MQRQECNQRQLQIYSRVIQSEQKHIQNCCAPWQASINTPKMDGVKNLIHETEQNDQVKALIPKQKFNGFVSPGHNKALPVVLQVYASRLRGKTRHDVTVAKISKHLSGKGSWFSLHHLGLACDKGCGMMELPSPLGPEISQPNWIPVKAFRCMPWKEADVKQTLIRGFLHFFCDANEQCRFKVHQKTKAAA